MHAEHDHFLRLPAKELEGGHEVGESELMDGGFAGETGERGAFETDESSGGLADVDGVEDQQPADSGDAREQGETLRSSVEELRSE